MASAQELRALAEWQRKFAETIGSEAERQSRLRFAEYLDKLAAEADAKTMLEEMRTDPRFARH